MSSVENAIKTQLANIEAKTGKPLAALIDLVLAQGLAKHGEMVAWAKAHLALGHGDANTLVHTARQRAEPPPAAPDDPLDALYSGPKAHLRPVHETLMTAIGRFGPFEVAPKKGYVSLRRAKQFAMLGPKTNSRCELGINLREEASHPLVKAEPPGGMCHYTASISAPDQVDDALLEIVRRAYSAAG